MALEWIPERGQSVELLAVGRSGDAICGHTLGGNRTAGVGGARVLVRCGFSLVRPVEGEVFTVDVISRSREGSLWNLEGALGAPRFEPESLRLEPLALLARPGQSPGETPDPSLDRTPGWGLDRSHDWSHGESDEPGNEPSRRRPSDERPAYELERIVPRVPGFPLSGSAAIQEIAAFHEAGDHDVAELLAGELLARDLRCLEAHALLGRFYSEGPVEQRWTERALRHYRVGAAIGELSLDPDFPGQLPWWWAGNRAFLRCLGGYGRALERVGDAGSAREVFERLLRLAPQDPLGVRNVLSAAAG